jgi:hypothetical protein
MGEVLFSTIFCLLYIIALTGHEKRSESDATRYLENYFIVLRSCRPCISFGHLRCPR